MGRYVLIAEAALCALTLFAAGCLHAKSPTPRMKRLRVRVTLSRDMANANGRLPDVEVHILGIDWTTGRSHGSVPNEEAVIAGTGVL